jgi:UDP-glucuronate decarboxylase
MRAIVTGAAGFLGSHLCDRLLAEGLEVVGIDNLMTGSERNLEAAEKSGQFRFVRGDVRNLPPSFWQLFGSRFLDFLFNLACPASPVHYQADPYGTLMTCVLGASEAASAARTTGCRVIHASTSEVYGDPLVHPQRESYWGNVNPVGPRSCYDEGKRAAETLLRDASVMWGIDVRIARIFNTYGPRMALNDGRVVSNFVLQALLGKPLTVYGDGTQTRSFCHCSDLVDGLWRMATHPRMPGGPFIANLGNPGEFTIEELAAIVSEETGAPFRTVTEALPTDDPKIRRPDISLASSVLGFRPTVPLREGIQTVVDDFRKRLGKA